MKKLYNLVLFILVSILLSSDQPPRNVPYNSKDFKILPPTFITLKNIEGCNPDLPFPQRVSLPFFTNSRQIQFSCKYYDSDHVAWAMYVFYEEWVESYGDEGAILKDVLSNIEIQWGARPRVEERVFDITGQFLERANVVGLMLSPTSVWVSVEDNISDTALVHELVHISLKALCGSADPDHEGTSHPCWERHHSEFIDSVNETLQDKYAL